MLFLVGIFILVNYKLKRKSSTSHSTTASANLQFTVLHLSIPSSTGTAAAAASGFCHYSDNDWFPKTKCWKQFMPEILRMAGQDFVLKSQ